MRFFSSLQIIAIAFVLVVVGFLIPLFMVLGIIKASFLLSFLGYAASFTGLILGIIGTALYSRRDR